MKKAIAKNLNKSEDDSRGSTDKERALTTTAAMERAVVKGQVIRRAVMEMLKSKMNNINGGGDL